MTLLLFTVIGYLIWRVRPVTPNETLVENASSSIAEESVEANGFDASAAGWIIYRNEQYKVEVRYPQDWSSSYRDGPLSGVSPPFENAVFAVEFPQGRIPYDELDLIIETAIYPTIDDWSSHWRQSIEKGGAAEIADGYVSGTITAIEDITIDGKPAKKLILEESGLILPSLCAAVMHWDYVYTLCYTKGASTAPQNDSLKIFNAAMNTLRFF